MCCLADDRNVSAKFGDRGRIKKLNWKGRAFKYQPHRESARKYRLLLFLAIPYTQLHIPTDLLGL